MVLVALPVRAGTRGWPWPVPTDPPAVTGTFMESRGTRFHTGMDVRTEGRTGLPVASPVEGSVRRIRCSARGYGLALYVAAGDGRTVVFAHLDRFFAPAADRLAKAQAATGLYEQDIEVAPGEIPVRRGEIVALSGETGIGAPHLHVEVRDAGQRPLNPADMFEIPDQVPPEVRALRLAPVDVRSPLPVEIGPGSGPVPATGRWVVEVLAVDHTGFAPFAVAPRSISLFVDGTLHYRMSNDAVSFGQVREMRLDQRRGARGRWYRMARRQGLTLPGRDGAGSPVVVADRAVELFVVVEDARGLRGEFRAELQPVPVASPVEASGITVTESLLVAEFAGASEMPPLLEGPDSHHLLGESGSGWRVALPREDLVDGRWKLLHRGEIVDEVELRIPRPEVAPCRFEGAPTLEGGGPEGVYPGGALVVRTVSVEGSDGLRPIGRGLELVSHGVVPRRGLVVSHPEAGSGGRLLMRWDRDRWSALTSTGATGEFGTFALMEDREAPEIGDLEGAGPVVRRTPPQSAHGVPLPPWPAGTIRVADRGSGLPERGPRVTLDGHPWPVRYDGERDRLLLDWFVAPAPGTHVLEVEATDLAGNRTVRRWDVEFRH